MDRRQHSGPRRARGPLERDPAAAPATLEQIARGLAMLELLGAIRYATNEQLHVAFADGAATGGGYATNRALRELFDGGWIDRIPVRIPRAGFRRDSEGLKEAYVNVLGPRGIETLKEQYSRRGRRETIRFAKRDIPRRHQPFIHTHGVVDWYVTVRAAAREHGWHLTRWLDDKALALGKRRGYGFATNPDGFSSIEADASGARAAQFVEIDLGAETVGSDDMAEDWAHKFRSYDAYLRPGGGYAVDFGDLATPTLMIVTTDEGRLATILDAAGRAEIGGVYWATTFARLHQAGFFGRIWHLPGTASLCSLADRLAW